MITEETVLVLGAGASMHLDLPLGARLKRDIVDNLQTKGTAVPRNLLIEAGVCDRDIDLFIGGLSRSILPSVDVFLAHNPAHERTGKLAIAQALLPLEDKRKYFEVPDNKGNWYPYFWQRLIDGTTHITENKLTILTFNYDRSLEHCLFNAMKNTFESLTDEDCVLVMKNFPLIHLHGDLCPLDVLDPDGTPYGLPGGKIGLEDIEKAAEAIRIPSDDIGDSLEFRRAREAIRSAQIICFLGFGFHRESLDRLGCDELNDGQHVFGAAVLETNEECLLHRGKFRGGVVKLYNQYKNSLDFLRNVSVLG